MTVEVRAFSPSDARVCCDVINRAILAMDGLNDAARSHIQASNTPERLGADLERWITLVATIDDEVVGLGALDGNEAKRVYVDPEVQGAGAASALLAALEEIAAQRFDEIRLEASPSSVEFYAGRGYRPVGHDRLEIGQAEFRFVHMTKNVGGTDTSQL